MQIKNIIIWIGILLVVSIGGYITYTSFMAGSAPLTAQNATTTPSATGEQVQAQEVKVGTGAEATPGSKVSVLYTGQLQDGTVFDSSAAHGNQPLEFVLGEQGLIPGFQVGVNGMKVGGERLIAIPPALGYGAQEVKEPSGIVIIPANSTIIFRIQLIKVTPAAASTAQ